MGVKQRYFKSRSSNKTTNYIVYPPLQYGGSLYSLNFKFLQPQVPLRLPCYDFTPITNQ